MGARVLSTRFVISAGEIFLFGQKRHNKRPATTPAETPRSTICLSRMATAAFFPPPMPSPPPPPESLFAFYLLAPIAGTLLVPVVILLLCLDANYLRARNRIRHRLEHPPRLAEPTKPLANDGLQFYNSNSKQDYEVFATLKEPSSPAARMKLLPSAVEVVIAEDSSTHGGSFSTTVAHAHQSAARDQSAPTSKRWSRPTPSTRSSIRTYTPEQVNLDRHGEWLTTSRLLSERARRHADDALPHSNAEDLGVTYGIWSRLSKELQVNVLSYEYSGYGHATGRASESNLVVDANAALELLTKKFGLIPARDIVLYGRSLGSFPTCALAKRYSVRGVILCERPRERWGGFSSIGSLAPSCTDGVASTCHRTHIEVHLASPAHPRNAGCRRRLRTRRRCIRRAAPNSARAVLD